MFCPTKDILSFAKIPWWKLQVLCNLAVPTHSTPSPFLGSHPLQLPSHALYEDVVLETTFVWSCLTHMTLYKWQPRRARDGERKGNSGELGIASPYIIWFHKIELRALTTKQSLGSRSKFPLLVVTQCAREPGLACLHGANWENVLYGPPSHCHVTQPEATRQTTQGFCGSLPGAQGSYTGVVKVEVSAR